MKIRVGPTADYSKYHCALTLSPDELQCLSLAVRELEKQVREDQAMDKSEPKMYASRLSSTTLPYVMTVAMSPKESSRPPKV